MFQQPQPVGLEKLHHWGCTAVILGFLFSQGAREDWLVSTNLPVELRLLAPSADIWGQLTLCSVKICWLDLVLICWLDVCMTLLIWWHFHKVITSPLSDWMEHHWPHFQTWGMLSIEDVTKTGLRMHTQPVLQLGTYIILYYIYIIYILYI